MNNKLHICMYHYTRDLLNSPYPAIKGLDLSLFIRQLDFFRDNFKVVTMEDVLDAYDGKKTDTDAVISIAAKNICRPFRADFSFATKSEYPVLIFDEFSSI